MRLWGRHLPPADAPALFRVHVFVAHDLTMNRSASKSSKLESESVLRGGGQWH